MGKQLQELNEMWVAVEKRFDAVVPDVYPIIMQFRNLQSGAWPRVVIGHEMLDERLAALGAPTAAAPAAANDAQVRDPPAEIADAKSLCRRLSKAFWECAPRVNRSFGELEELRNSIDKVVKEKSKLFSASKSVPELKKLRDAVNTLLVATRSAFLQDKLPKPDDPTLA